MLGRMVWEIRGEKQDADPGRMGCHPSEHSLALWLPAEVGQVWLQGLCPCLECPFVTHCLSVL